MLSLSTLRRQCAAEEVAPADLSRGEALDKLAVNIHDESLRAAHTDEQLVGVTRHNLYGVYGRLPQVRHRSQGSPWSE